MAVLPNTTPNARLRDAQDVVGLLGETINQVRRGEIDPKIANAVGYLGTVLMKGLHETEIEKRLVALEAAVRRQPATPEFMLEEEHFVEEVGRNGNGKRPNGQN